MQAYIHTHKAKINKPEGKRAASQELPHFPLNLFLALCCPLLCSEELKTSSHYWEHLWEHLGSCYLHICIATAWVWTAQTAAHSQCYLLCADTWNSIWLGHKVHAESSHIFSGIHSAGFYITLLDRSLFVFPWKQKLWKVVIKDMSGKWVKGQNKPWKCTNTESRKDLNITVCFPFYL